MGVTVGTLEFGGVHSVRHALDVRWRGRGKAIITQSAATRARCYVILIYSPWSVVNLDLCIGEPGKR